MRTPTIRQYDSLTHRRRGCNVEDKCGCVSVSEAGVLVRTEAESACCEQCCA